MKVEPKKVVLKVEMTITVFAGSGDVEDDFIVSLIDGLSIDPPEDTPDDVYFMTKVESARCIQFGEAKE
jgi:hypothetical protein